jgi:hypothetical protein
MIVLLSPASLARPWINFEAGGGWMRGSRLLLLCHSGQRKSDLPAPYSHVQALELDDPKFSDLLFQVLAKEFDVDTMPRIDGKAMRRELKAAID